MNKIRNCNEKQGKIQIVTCFNNFQCLSNKKHPNYGHRKFPSKAKGTARVHNLVSTISVLANSDCRLCGQNRTETLEGNLGKVRCWLIQ